MARASFAWFLIGCSSAPPPKTEAPVAPVAPADAAPVVPPDTGPPAAVLAAPAYVFKYNTADRAETWTLRQAEGQALVVVESAKGTLEYTGTATEGASLAIAVATSTAKLALDCKREKLAVSAKCNDTKAKPIDVLNCYHPDFKAPMSFAPAPGIEYVVEPGCNGFRLAKP
jgi:hypothetical protein